MADMNELQRAARLQEIMRFVSAPKTIEEIADHFGWHPQTASRYIWELQGQGRVKESVRKKGRKKLWQTSAPIVGGRAIFITSLGTFELKELLVEHQNRQHIGTILSGALAYLYRRAYYRKQDQSDALNVVKQGYLDPLLQVRKVVDMAFQSNTVIMEALEQLLVEMPEVWNDSGAILEMLGFLEMPAIEEKASWFDKWASEVLSQIGR